MAEIIDFERFRASRMTGGPEQAGPGLPNGKGVLGMAQTIDGERLKRVRTVRGLTQEALAKKAALNKHTIYRLEKGKKPIRRNNLDRLARALDVDPGVLTGEKPIPTDLNLSGARQEETNYQFNVRVDAHIRNAFSLAALRYKLPVRRIVDFAPLLFMIAAEGSLRRRREKLAELKAAFDHASVLRQNLPHLPLWIGEIEQHEANAAEERSIDARDLFGAAMPDQTDVYDEDEDNPFVRFLKEAAGGLGDIAINVLGPTRTEYEICRSEATELAGGGRAARKVRDEQKPFADNILEGSVLIHEIPRELLRPEAVAERVEWIRQKVEALPDFRDII